MSSKSHMHRIARLEATQRLQRRGLGQAYRDCPRWVKTGVRPKK